MFKQDSEFSAWWYPLLKPHRHYLPLNSSLDDYTLLSSLAWARSHDLAAREVARAGRTFVLEFLDKNTDVYMCKLFETYADAYGM